MVEFGIVLVLCAVLLLGYCVMLKTTVFGINLKSANYNGAFVFYTLIAYVIPSSLLLNFFPIQSFWVAFKVHQDTVFFTTLLILWSVFVFYVVLWLISKTNKKYFRLNPFFVTVEVKRPLLFVRITISVCLILIIFTWVFLGVGHSFSMSMLNDVSVSEFRMNIKASRGLRAIKHLFIFITPLLAAIVASPVYDGDRKIERLLSVLAIIFIAGWGGSKGPILGVILVLMVSHITFKRVRFGLLSPLKIVLFLIFTIGVTYRVVLFQYPHMKDIFLFADYFYQRVFVAQMIGVYEQYNVFLQDYNYIFHGVPFASYFIDYPQFHKDLMLVTEDRTNPDNIGIKNTLFIAEAYGMGGVVLMVISPVIMALNFSLSYVWMVFLINKIAFVELEFTKRIVAISIFSYVGITGGFSDLMFFKITIMMTLLLLPFLFFHKLVLSLSVLYGKSFSRLIGHK